MKIKLKAFYTDGQDGTGCTTLYRDRDDYISRNLSKYDTAADLGDAWDRADSGKNPYEDGEIEDVELEFRIENDELVMVGHPSFHWGNQ